jgi:hypothetical protein
LLRVEEQVDEFVFCGGFGDDGDESGGD